MCLAIPGKIESITAPDGDMLHKKGKVNFGGILKEVSLAYVPQAKVGELSDYCIIPEDVYNLKSDNYSPQ